MARARVLFVDDNDFLLTTMRLVLESSGYSVVTAATGKAALDCMSEPFNAVVVDYELPDMDGRVLATSLRRAQPQLPIVLFSGCLDIPCSALHDFTAVVSKGNSIQHLLTALQELTLPTL